MPRVRFLAAGQSAEDSVLGALAGLKNLVPCHIAATAHRPKRMI